LRFGNQFSVLYTSGVAADGVVYPEASQLGGRLYPDRGGDISVFAARDIQGVRGNQLVTPWLWRVGHGDSGTPALTTAWTVNFAQFAQGIGALGGGDIDISAGGTINDLSVSIPTIGRQIGGVTPAESVLEVRGGGDLRVAAGESLLGGSFYVGRGRAELRAGGDIGEGASLRSPVLALSNATFDLTARRNLSLEAVVDPMMLPQGTAQRPQPAEKTTFVSYDANARVDLTAIAGDVGIRANVTSLRTQLNSIPFTTEADRLSLRLYPAALRAGALRGDVTVSDTVTLMPAPKGNIELLAFDNLLLDGSLLLSDAERGVFPTVSAPAESLVALTRILGSPRSSDTGFNALVPVHSLASQPDGIADTAPARFIALTGDIAANGASFVYLAKPGRFVARRDISQLGLIGQNLDAADVTTLAAGRDIAYPSQRDDKGNFVRTLKEIRLGGPGRLELEAGRDVELETSLGISTVGNLTNLALAERGADVSITAGAGSRQADFTAFVQRYLPADGQKHDYDDLLIEYMSTLAGTALSDDEARRAFVSLDRSRQAPLIEKIFFAELRTGGTIGAMTKDYTRAFAALETLFPGANPNVDAGETNPYSGDLSLFLSRVYTLAGGDIRLLVPGGAINAGIATPPTAFGLNKAAQELGVVAQRSGNVYAAAFGDFEVNESRVFSADGDDILVWSTLGDIDAGRGAKTAISAPPPSITFDAEGNPVIKFPAALTGSGIQTLASSPGVDPGNVFLFAPRGVVNAGDAGIVAGNLTIGATAVLGADNISVSGVSVGVPVDTGGFAAALTGVSAVASSASNAAADTVGPSRQAQSETPLADQALGFLDVFVTGFGEECDPKKEACAQ
jgi:hypothetical protein